METGDAGSFTAFDNTNIALAEDAREEEDDHIKIHAPVSRLVVRLPDLDNPDATIQRGWGTAPDWRTVYPGLNFEGRCTNSSCKAHNKLVWCTWGFKNNGTFNWLENSHEIVCPTCKQYVDPQNVGYTKCWWKVEGKKRAKPGKPFEVVKGVWKYANYNGVTTYVYSPDSLVDWGELIIKTNSNSSNNKPPESHGYVRY